MNYRLTILGSHSARPMIDKHPSAQVLQINPSELFLIDCGEGTQVQLLRYGIKAMRISRIFISHLHGDHYLGLLGLLDTYALSGRSADLHIYAPPMLEEVIKLHCKISKYPMPYRIVFQSVVADQARIIYSDTYIVVSTVVLQHSATPCTGFVFQQQPLQRRMLRAKILQYDIPNAAIKHIKAGNDYTLPNGTRIPNDELTDAPRAPHSYAYCSDTAYAPDIIPHIAGVSVLYHEATYLQDRAHKAAERGHSTAAQAAQIAQAAQVGRLLIGHFSAAYHDYSAFLTEARPYFSPTYLATEGSAFEFIDPTWQPTT